MKRFTAFIVAFLMILSLVACGSENSDSTTDTGTGKTQETIDLTMGASSPGSAGQVYVSGIASVVNQYGTGITFTPETTGGGGASSEMVSVLAGEMDMCFTSNKIGNETYQENPDLRSLWGIYYQEFMCVTNDPNITDITQFEGKTISIGPVGGTPEFSSLEIFDLFDINCETVNMSWTDSFIALKEGKIDAVTGCCGHPASGLLEQETAFDSYWVTFTDEQIQKICDTYSHFAPVEMKATTYADMADQFGEDAMWPTVGIWMGIYTTLQTDEDAIYELCCCILDHTEDLVSATFENAAETTQTSFLNTNVPLHPGAIRYYEERGIEIPPEYIVD